jgi:ribosome hibernation promoting factor
MRFQLTVRHGQVPESVRKYVEAKIRKLERRVHEATLVEVVLDHERNPKIADDHVVEATFYMKGANLHGREAAATFEAAADLLVDKLERQVERARDKKTLERRRRAAQEASAFAPLEGEPGVPETEESAA